MAALNTISATVQAVVNLAAGITADFADATQQIAENASVSISTVGTGADAANQYWSDSRSIPAGSNESLDLSGTLTNALGQTVSFSSIKVIYIKNQNTAGDLVVGAGTNPWITMLGGAAHTIQVRRSGMFLNACADATGWAVTATTGDVLKITNSDGTNAAIYDIILIGAQ